MPYTKDPKSIVYIQLEVYSQQTGKLLKIFGWKDSPQIIESKPSFWKTLLKDMWNIFLLMTIMAMTVCIMLKYYITGDISYSILLLCWGIFSKLFILDKIEKNKPASLA